MSLNTSQSMFNPVILIQDPGLTNSSREKKKSVNKTLLMIFMRLQGLTTKHTDMTFWHVPVYLLSHHVSFTGLSCQPGCRFEYLVSSPLLSWLSPAVCCGRGFWGWQAAVQFLSAISVGDAMDPSLYPSAVLLVPLNRFVFLLLVSKPYFFWEKNKFV